uniref:Guanylate cyclase domain-containing protein n=1 Tax=Anisakis simplex TaxID=6269 RepID=A0A0M3J1P4_ANISI
LADEKGIEESVRIGDIYAVMIVHNVRKSNFKKVRTRKWMRLTANSLISVCLSFQAYTLIEQLQQRQPRIDVSRYVNAQILDTICDALQIKRITAILNTAQEVCSDEDGNAGGVVEYSHAMKRQLQQETSFGESTLRQVLD